MNRLLIIAAALVIVLAAGYWFATGGGAGREPAAWLTAGPIAHRGQWSEGSRAPENSLAAFEEAASNGFAIELDAQRTLDGQTVVIHDYDLERLTGTSGMVADTSLQDLQDLRLLGGDERIPTLEEVLALVGGRVPVFVEIKNEGEVGALEADVAKQLASYKGDAAVMSFNPFSLAAVAETAPGIPRGQLSGSFRGEDLPVYQVFLLRNLLMNWSSKPDFIAYELSELPSPGTSIQRWRGRPLLGWTAEDEAGRIAAGKVCDAVICNPAALPAPE